MFCIVLQFCHPYLPGFPVTMNVRNVVRMRGWSLLIATVITFIKLSLLGTAKQFTCRENKNHTLELPCPGLKPDSATYLTPPHPGDLGQVSLLLCFSFLTCETCIFLKVPSQRGGIRLGELIPVKCFEKGSSSRSLHRAGKSQIWI